VLIVGCTTLVLWLASAGDAAASGWKLRPTPNPLGATHSQLTGVSCPSRNFCLAVGYSSARAGAFKTLVERWDGKGWSIQRGVRPAGAQVSVLSAVSCASRRSCTAVGYFNNRAGVAVPLAEHWDGRVWSVQPPPRPRGAMFGDLVAIACAPSSSCVAVGSFADAHGNEFSLAELWDRTRWSIEPLQNPPDAAASRLKGVSCTSPTACTAVGTVVDSAGDYITLTERWNGTDWAMQSSPDPAGGYSQLVGVACASIRSCEAVGFFANPNGPLLTLAERWDGASWAIQPTENRRGGRTSQLFAVACPMTIACTAVGNFANNAGAFGTLAEQGGRNRWAILPTADRPGATNSSLDAVACASSRVCTAVGYFIDRSRKVRTLAEQYA
jgi:hypothetical protein